MNLFLFILSGAINLLLIYFLIPLLNRLKLGQHVYELAPESHQKKQGVPTMGGISFVITTSLLAFVFIGLKEKHLLVVFSMILFGLIGFLDDSMKLFKAENKGLSAKEKLILQILASLFMAFLLGDKGTRVLLPFTGIYINLGILYYPFVAVFMTLLVNSTNLTDGVDGLLATVSFVTCLFFLVVTKDLFMPELFRLTLIFLGSLLGYIYYNRYPAKIFMGDTGSMAIGGFIGTMMLLTSTPLFIFFVGFIYVIESLSVILQVWSFQTKGVRIFKMSPIHHHYELSGYSENKIVLSFAAVTFVGLLLGLLAYRI
ncbi:MAG: phospho-N-acetylmuramoyl-pentapeptide-transferase [Tissierellia bacterium]|jgi:phospho-N-acetylmuramoyl-pentapeptide-transferase|nr:phospho-N-acetylmuramoyl-pentapeptide-transferase [Tissierellia bacterium]